MAERSQTFYVLNYAFSGSAKRLGLELVACTLSAGLVLAGGLRMLPEHCWWESRGRRTVARVTAVEEAMGSNALTSRRLLCSFVLDEGVVHGRTGALPSAVLGRWRLRAEFPVAHDPAHPSRNGPVFFGKPSPPETLG